MLDTPTAAPDITTADLERWVDTFYVETAKEIIDDSKNLRQDWKIEIKLQFREFFYQQDLVKARTGENAWSYDSGYDAGKIKRVDKLYLQAEKMLYAKVHPRFHLADVRGMTFILSIRDGVTDLISLMTSGDNDSSGYADEEFDGDAPEIFADGPKELIFPSSVLGITDGEYLQWKTNFVQSGFDGFFSEWFQVTIMPTFAPDGLDEEGAAELMQYLNQKI